MGPRFVLFLLFAAAFLTGGSGPAHGQSLLTWKDVVEEAVRNNPEISAGRQSVHQARFRHEGSRSPFLPQVSLEAAYDQSHFSDDGGFLSGSSGSTDQYSLGLSIRQSLFSGFRNAAEMNRTEAEVEAAEADFSAVTAQVGFDLKSAFASLLFGQQQLALTEAIAVRRKENVNLVELRFEAGREHKGSFLRSQAAHHRAEFEVAQAGRALKVAQRDLATVLGRKDSNDLRVEGSFDVVSPGPTPDFRLLAKQTPARLLPAARTRAAEASVTAANATFYPDVSASGSVSRSGSDFPPDQDQWTAGVLLTLPLFAGGRNYYDLQDARSEFRKSQENLVSSEDQAALELEQAYAAFLDGIERVSVQQDFLDAAEVRAEIARSLYTSGLLSFEDWDLIENDLISARKDMLVGLRDRLITEANWEQAQGKGLVP